MNDLNRRAAVKGLVALGAAALAPGTGVTANVAQPAMAAPKTRRGSFPRGFLWGAATAAHQVEGNNVASDSWLLEHLPSTTYAEPSGDACDHFARYPADIRLLAELGLNTYRFSLEWARIEPEQGAYSPAMLEHYRRMIATCREHDVTPMVTFNHFTNPRWFAARGGWQAADAGDCFVRYCERATAALGDLLAIASTFNEPNVGKQIRWGEKAPDPRRTKMLAEAAQACGSPQFFNHTAGDLQRAQGIQIDAHQRAYIAMKSGRGNFPVGVSLAMADEQGTGEPGAESDRAAAAKREYLYDAWLDAARSCDFVGVQTYTRNRVGPDGDLPVPSDAAQSQLGQEYYPQALANTVRYAAARSRVPVYVTENGIATEDDPLRIRAIDESIAGLRACLAQGIDLRGYIHWSLLDNYEWIWGYRPRFGLVAVDRVTQQRTIKPSARRLGAIARSNGVILNG